MRKMLILLALTVLTIGNLGCSQCRGLFRRGAPCGGTALAAPPMLGGAIPLGNPVRLQQPPQIVQPGILAQPNCCCEQAPVCCDPCPTQCVPTCDPCQTGYVGADCACPTGSGEYFGGYVEGGGPPVEGTVIPQGSATYPNPTN